ncbi:MAG: hypothetical protein V4482_02290 [Pseudomonadota bacterium]
MSTNFQIVDLPGKGNVRIATTDTVSNDASYGVKSPEWMVQIDNITVSTIDGFEDYIELFGWQGESSRLTGPDVGGPLFTSSTLRHTDLILMVPFGGHAAQIETMMNRGENIESVKIIRLGNVLQSKVRLQELEFNTCKIQTCQQQLDRMIVHVMIGIKTNTVYVFDQTGLCTGQMVSKTDYIRNVAE